MLLPSLTFLQDCCGEFCEAIFVKKKNTVLFQKSVLHKDLFVICDLSVGCTHFPMFPDPGFVSLLVQLTVLYSFSDNLSLA